MSASFELNAERREATGKGFSRRLRREEKVPGIVYGGDSEPENITLSHHEMLHNLENEAFYSHILDLKLDGKSQQVILKDLQRHPAKPFITHVDLLRVKKDTEIHVHVPLHFINEEKCEGIKTGGGILNRILTEVEISCLPAKLPEFIEVDVLNLNVGESIHLTELQIPEGVKLLALGHGDESHDTAVVTVQLPRAAAASDDASEEAASEGDSENTEE